MQPLVFGFIGAASVIVVALVFLIVFQVCLLLRYSKKEPVLPVTQPKGKESSSHTLKVTDKDRGRVFTYKEVEELSEDFSNHIGEGSINHVYKGILQDGTEVAIKRMKDSVARTSGAKDKFQSQVDLLSRVHHQHLINYVGYCDEGSHQMLLCQYAPNGSLYEILHGEIKEEHLSWKQRLRIATGISYGLSYLHHSCNPPIVHGDLTSVNILLTEDFAAKITGLGRVPILRAHSQELTNGARLSGDMESERRILWSRAADVYSFGILLLELLSGRVAYCEESGMITDWALPYLQSKEQMMGLMDSSLKNASSPLEFCAICEIARLCIQKESITRPSMSEVSEMLAQTLLISVELAAPISSPVTLRGLMAAFN